MNRARVHRFFEFLRPFRWSIAGQVAMTAVLSLLAMAPPLLLRAVINRVIVGGERSLLPWVGAFMIIVPVLSAACGYFQVLGIAYVGQRFVMNVRCALYDHFTRLSMRFFGQENTGMLVNRLMGDSGVLQQMLSVATVQVISDFICSAFAIVVTFALNWRLALLLVLVVVLFVVNYHLNIQRIRVATRGYRGAEDNLAAGVQNRLVANLTVKSYGAEPREHNLFREQSDLALQLERQGQAATNTFSMNTAILRDVGRITIYFLGCAMVLRGEASYGDVIAFTTYAMQLLAPAVRFSTLAQQWQDVMISADRLFELFEREPEVAQPANPRRLPAVRGQVDFDHVSFAYEKDRPVLQDLDFHVRPGETIALVGPTGCGKTTILSLLLRFFDVQQGAVRLDGVDLRELDLQVLRRHFSIVLQESLLFDISVAQNIAYSRPSATREDIVQAARIAEIHRDIEELPQGYDTLIGGADTHLSVGQRQRISIARAVLANPALLIMDEATSALDSESERAIQAAMDRFLKGRTSFIVAHRLSTIRNASRIILLNQGHICEIGSHDELAALPHGRYRALYEKHAGKEILVDE